jgi:hypothetical protein
MTAAHFGGDHVVATCRWTSEPAGCDTHADARPADENATIDLTTADRLGHGKGEVWIIDAGFAVATPCRPRGQVVSRDPARLDAKPRWSLPTAIFIGTQIHYRAILRRTMVRAHVA